MTQEEKAKRFDEALEQLKGLIEGIREDKCAITEEDIIDIFPELKENEDEDERIRKAQLDYWRSVGGKEWHGVPVQETIAWLERQKTVEWSDEDEIGSDATIELLEYFINYAPEFRRPTIRRSIDWLKSLKQRMEEQ